MNRNYTAAAQASGRVETIRKTELTNLRDTYRAEAHAPIPNTHHLTPEGQRDRQDRQRAAARDKALARLDHLETEFNVNADYIRAAANAVHTPPTDPTAALLAEQRQTRAWNRAQTLLNSGRTVHQVIRTANDADTIEALRAELPTWITAQSPARIGVIMGSDPDAARDFTPLMRTLDQRLAEITPGLDSNLLKYRLELDRIEPGARVILRGLRNEIEHGRPMDIGTALEAHYVDQFAARTIPDPNAQTEPTTSGRTTRTLKDATNAHYGTGNDAA
ncbi:hypothetical protein [Nocardiopsis dassonvillei]|uniref:hypothetical protein n=1 Tax=Nocardiopsis dassonvillei TaxID=2014 RepID=UPI003628F42D